MEQSEELSQHKDDEEEDEEEEEALEGEEGQEKVVGDDEEAGGGGGEEWEGLMWSGRRAGDKETLVSAILEEKSSGERRKHRTISILMVCFYKNLNK